MEPVTVGFLGGPQDGRFRTVPVDGTGRPPPVLETVERTGASVDMHRVLAAGEPTNLPPLFRPVTYRLMVNRASDGPLWFYVHPSVTFPGVD